MNNPEATLFTQDGKEMTMNNPEGTFSDVREEVAKVESVGSTVEALGGVAGIVLAILGLASIQTDYMLAVAAIVIGVTLVAQSALTGSEYSDILTKSGGRMKAGFEGELGAEAMAGAAAIVLGILGILGMHPMVLGSVAVIVLGVGFLLGSGVNSRLNAIELEFGGQHEFAKKVARGMASGAVGAQVLVGLAAVILGILAIVGIDAQILVLTALLILGASALLSGGTLGSKMFSMLAK